MAVAMPSLAIKVLAPGLSPSDRLRAPSGCGDGISVMHCVGDRGRTLSFVARTVDTRAEAGHNGPVRCRDFAC